MKAVVGQYWAGNSFVHRMDPRAKILLALAFIVIAFCAQTFAALGVCALFTVLFYVAAQIPFTQGFRSVAPLLVFVVFTALFNVVYVQGGPLYFEWWVIRISEAGVVKAAFISIRLTMLLLGVSLLTLTTPTLDITEAFERLLMPFSRFGLPAHELSMMMGIALRFLPQFATELQIVYRAQLSRGATISFNPFKGGVSSLTSLIVPLFTSAFRHAETLASAMEARCYHGGINRTRLHPLSYSRNDAIGIAVMALLFALVIASNFIG